MIKLLKKSIKEGAELICGGFSKKNTTYECTVLKNPKEQSEISKNEIFGPILCVYDFKSIDDAIKRAK